MFITALDMPDTIEYLTPPTCASKVPVPPKRERTEHTFGDFVDTKPLPSFRERSQLSNECYYVKVADVCSPSRGSCMFSVCAY